MELSRQEYPGMLGALQPMQAVAVMNDRVKHINKVNAEIAEWLQERRRIEETYAQSLRKLARKQFPEEYADLGIFTTPWQKVVSEIESIAEAHHTLAAKMELDIERPLKEFSSANREMQQLSTTTGNLAAMAKEVEAANKKTDKLKEKGGKASAEKVANAASELDSANSTWDSQAPYIFEKLQAVDESRLDHLRAVLTQLQTHESDRINQTKAAAEECLNSLLNVEVADEIKTFSLKAVAGRPKTERARSNRQTVTASTLAPATPSQHGDDGSSQRSSSLQEQKQGRFSGLKRLGTVVGRKRHSIYPAGRELSPERKSSSNLGSAFGSFGKRSKETPPDELHPPSSPSRRRSEARSQPSPRLSESATSTFEARESADRPNGAVLETVGETSPVINAVNGAPPVSDIPILQEPLQPAIVSATTPEATRDAEGYSVPQSSNDLISQAEQEAAASGDNPPPQFRVDIRNAPIQEEEDDKDTALASLSDTLRAQVMPSRKAGTVRGRRDNRNTILFPAPQALDVPNTDATEPGPSSAPLPASPLAAPATPATSAAPAATHPSPFKTPHRQLVSEDHAASDTQSVRSGRSLSSAASTTIRHPDMHEAGLNSSVIETVSSWFEEGSVTKTLMVGEVALVFNPIDLSSPFGTETVRLDNFSALDKVAPNPAFIEHVADMSGTYTVNLANITKTSVAFKYQVHVDDLASQAPLLLAPAWKVEPTQTSVILNYSLNPSFKLPSTLSSITLSNVVIIIRLNSSAPANSTGGAMPAAKITSCKLLPQGGTFSRERGLVYWRLGDITLTPEAAPQQLKARFFTDGEAKAGNIEGRWEISGDGDSGLGSGLSVQLMDSRPPEVPEDKDPFADDGVPATPHISWKTVNEAKKIRSGTYLAV